MKHAKPIVLFSAAATVIALVATVASAASPVPRPADGVAAGACNDQPNMASALAQLRGARAALDKAEQNKGGWRDNAIKATDNAIGEAVRGCGFAR